MRDIKAQLIRELTDVAQSDPHLVANKMAHIINALRSSTVSVTVDTPERQSPSGYTPPAYDPAVDGNYSRFLARHNID